MIVNQASLYAIERNLRATFNNAFEQAETFWMDVATRVPSATKIEDYGWLERFPKLERWIGDKNIQSLEAYGYNLENERFASTIEVDRDDIEDDSATALPHLDRLAVLHTEMFQGCRAQRHPRKLRVPGRLERPRTTHESISRVDGHRGDTLQAPTKIVGLGKAPGQCPPGRSGRSRLRSGRSRCAPPPATGRRGRRGTWRGSGATRSPSAGGRRRSTGSARSGASRAPTTARC